LNQSAVGPTAVLDTNVLIGALTRNILLSFADAGYFSPVWSDDILDEFQRVFVRRFGDEEIALRQRRNMEAAFPEARWPHDSSAVSNLDLPDLEDRHVVSVAIASQASFVVTENLKDFPISKLRPFNIEAISSDEFISGILDTADVEGASVLEDMRQRFKKPEITQPRLLRMLESRGLKRTATTLGKLTN